MGEKPRMVVPVCHARRAPGKRVRRRDGMGSERGIEGRAVDDLTRRRARSFGAVAGAYARVRPGYPAEAVRWILPPGAERVLDVGAGTGALTSVLVGERVDVVAVEPDEEMRRVLAARVPRADVRAGRAEALPLEDRAVDAVLGAQMWHWVEAEAAVPEVARVLRPGGSLGLLWNLRDESVPWMSALGRIMHGEDVAGALDGRVQLPVSAPFDALSRRQFPWRHELAREDLVDLVATRSHIQVMADDERAAVIADVRKLLDDHPDLAGRSVVHVPYVTTCIRATRRADAGAPAVTAR